MDRPSPFVETCTRILMGTFGLWITGGLATGAAYWYFRDKLNTCIYRVDISTTVSYGLLFGLAACCVFGVTDFYDRYQYVVAGDVANSGSRANRYFRWLHLLSIFLFFLN